MRYEGNRAPNRAALERTLTDWLQFVGSRLREALPPQPCRLEASPVARAKENVPNQIRFLRGISRLLINEAKCSGGAAPSFAGSGMAPNPAI